MTVTITCDVCGAPAPERVSIHDGQHRAGTLDLCHEHAAPVWQLLNRIKPGLDRTPAVPD